MAITKYSRRIEDGIESWLEIIVRVTPDQTTFTAYARALSPDGRTMIRRSHRVDRDELEASHIDLLEVARCKAVEEVRQSRRKISLARVAPCGSADHLQIPGMLDYLSAADFPPPPCPCWARDSSTRTYRYTPPGGNVRARIEERHWRLHAEAKACCVGGH